MTTIEMPPGLPAGDDTLREHLGYSLDLVAMALHEIAEPGHSDPLREWYRQMAAIEVFWSQARILTEFFAGTAASSTTAAAVHFTTSYVEYKFPKAEALWKMRNDQIAHLNYARTTNTIDKLQHTDIYLTADAISRAVEKFEKSLRPEAAKTWSDRRTGFIKIDAKSVYASPEPSACTAAPIGLTTQMRTAAAPSWGYTGPASPKP